MVPKEYGDQIVATQDGVKVYKSANGHSFSNILYPGDTPSFNNGALIGIYTGETKKILFRLWYRVQWVHYYQVSDTKKWNREMLDGWVKGAETSVQLAYIDLDKAYPNDTVNPPDPSGGTYSPLDNNPGGNTGGGNTGNGGGNTGGGNSDPTPTTSPKTTSASNDNPSGTTNNTWYFILGGLILVLGGLLIGTFTRNNKQQ